MRKLIVLSAVLAVMAMGADVDAAKEKANRTKCAAKLDNLGSSGCDGVAQPATSLIPKILRLRAAGKDDPAWQLTENGVRQTRHRGHVTVLKLTQTVDQCVAKMRRDGDSREDIEFIRALGARWIKTIKEATRANVDSFFDVWTEID